MHLLVWFNLNDLWRGELAAFRQRHPEIEVTVTTDLEDPGVAEADLAIGTAVPLSVVERAHKLRFLGVSLAGVDHLPLELLHQRGITLAAAHTNGIYVAERALALILGFLGNIAPYDRDLRQGKWHGFAAGEPADAAWHSLRGASVTLLGTGSIGQGLARLLAPFDCRITGYRRTNALASPPFDRMNTDLIEAVTGAHIVVCSLPLTEETRGVLSAQVFAAMPGALFVNVGRGAIADEAALYNALREGVLRGAAIDTWYRYPAGDAATHPGAFPFHTLDNVLLSPHLGGYTPQAVAASLRDIFRQLDIFLKTGDLPEAVDTRRRY